MGDEDTVTAKARSESPVSRAESTLHGRLLSVAEGNPDLPALHLGGVTRTFGQLARRCRAVGALVSDRTIPGDRVAFIAWNGPWWIDAYFGVPFAGRILALVSPRLTVGEIRDMLDTAGASIVIVDSDLLGGDMEGLNEAGRAVIALSEWEALVDAVASDDSALSRRVAGGDGSGNEVAWLVFTSGTTGRPKAAALTHANLLAAVDATNSARPLAPDDVYLFPFPLWHVAGYNVVIRLTTGRQVVLQRQFDAATIVSDIARRGATSMSVAATMLATILDAAEDDPSLLPILRQLREIHYGAASMPQSLLRRALEVLGVRMWQGYGMTELSGNAVFLSADDHDRAAAGDATLLGATGRAAPGVELTIVDDLGDDVEPGGVGEVVVRAPQAMMGYWNDPDATAAAFSADGWLRTGDLGSLRADGLLTLFDRKKDVIITGGENVSAREVEEVLRKHVDVVDVAVVGVKDAKWGENVCAVVVTAADSFDVQALRDFARGQLAGFKVPRHVALIESLPTNASGKVLKAELRDWLDQPGRLGERLS